MQDTLTKAELQARCRVLVEQAGGGQVVADRLGVTRQLINLALNADPETGDQSRILMRIASEIGGLTVERVTRYVVRS
jgi:hypothetical protein